jgi:hypothetical protein
MRRACPAVSKRYPRLQVSHPNIPESFKTAVIITAASVIDIAPVESAYATAHNATKEQSDEASVDQNLPHASICDRKR